MIRTLTNLPLVPTEHPEAMKRVFLAKGETLTNITQIAVFELKAGDVISEHKHWGIEEQLYVLEGDVEIVIDSKSSICHANDFTSISYLNRHALRAITDCRVLSIGCKINS